jgi:hypothetical protein
MTLQKVLGVVAFGILFCVGLGFPNVATSSENKMKEPEKIIIGKVLKIEGDNYVVRDREEGKEIRLQVDPTTKMNAAGVRTGDIAMAKVDHENHIEIILADPVNQFR